LNTWFVGYGSLMSAYGLGPQLSGILDARRVAIAAGRGFHKPAQRGGVLAMDLQVSQTEAALRGVLLGPLEPLPTGHVGALLLEVRAEAVPPLTRREGYAKASWAALEAAASGAVAPLLLRLAAGRCLRAYREALWELTGPSPLQAAHYLPHPLRVEGLEQPALVFLAPDPGWTGDPELPSAKAPFPLLAPSLLDRIHLSGPAAFPSYDPVRQGSYARMCFLAAAHGVHVADLLGGPPEPGALTPELLASLSSREAFAEERRALQVIPALSSARGYAARFPSELEQALQLAGLCQHLP